MFCLARFRLYHLRRWKSPHNSIPETGFQFGICATVRILFHFLQPELSSRCVIIVASQHLPFMLIVILAMNWRRRRRIRKKKNITFSSLFSFSYFSLICFLRAVPTAPVMIGDFIRYDLKRSSDRLCVMFLFRDSSSYSIWTVLCILFTCTFALNLLNRRINATWQVLRLDYFVLSPALHSFHLCFSRSIKGNNWMLNMYKIQMRYNVSLNAGQYYTHANAINRISVVW